MPKQDVVRALRAAAHHVLDPEPAPPSNTRNLPGWK
jgi:hypothetical protein